jgi:hypothetical protein
MKNCGNIGPGSRQMGESQKWEGVISKSSSQEPLSHNSYVYMKAF